MEGHVEPTDRGGRAAVSPTRAGARPADVTLVSQYFRPERGAAQVRLGSIVDELVRSGVTVRVVTALPNYPVGRIFDGWSRRPVQHTVEDGVDVTRVWMWASMGNGVGRILNYLTFGVMSLLGLLRTPRSHWMVVEYPTLFGALPAVVLGRLRRQRVVVIVADLWVDSIVATGTLPDGPAVAVLRRVERWMLRRAHAVTAVTEGVRDALLDKGVDRGRLTWLPNGADLTTFSPGEPDPSVRAEMGVPADHDVVLYAGTHGFVHGLEVVLDAAEVLAGEPVSFVLVGGGSEKDALVRAAAGRGLDNVVFLDPVAPEEIARMLRGSLAGLATVRSGDLYRTIRSAKALPVMSTGRPIIYSADDEGSRLVARIGAGIVTPPGDGPRLAEAVRALRSDRNAAAAMGESGRRWVEQNASWELLVRRWTDELETVTGDAVRPAVPPVATAPVLGFVGIHAGRRTDQPVSQNEVLAGLFEQSGYRVRRASAVRQRYLRTLHQVLSIPLWRDVDVVVVAVFSGPSFVMAELATTLAGVTGKRSVLFLHGGNLPVYAPKHRRRVDRVFTRAAAILAPSEYLASAFRSWGYDVQVIPNVLDVDRYTYHHRTAAQPKLLWMRTFHEHYNPLMAVRTLERVSREHPGASMTMAGADHGLLHETIAEAERLGVLDRIQFPGYVDHEQKLAAFEDHDLFLNTNRIDNMPVSVVEVSLAGIVPVATAVGGLPAIIDDGRNGILVDCDDDAAMADAVLGLLSDPARFSQMSGDAREFGLRSSWPSVRRLWEAQLDSVRSRRGPS